MWEPLKDKDGNCWGLKNQETGEIRLRHVSFLGKDKPLPITITGGGRHDSNLLSPNKVRFYAGDQEIKGIIDFDVSGDTEGLVECTFTAYVQLGD